MCDLVWYMSIWWYTWSRCDLHVRSRTHLQMRSSLILYDMSIWCTRTSSRDLASFLWELYAFLHEYYTTKSRNLQPLRILGGSCTWQRPRSMLRSLSPQVSERFKRTLKVLKDTIGYYPYKKQRYIYKGI